jgi:hypothetical protein
MRRWDGKFAAAWAVIAVAMLVAGCDRCGEWLKSEGGSAPLACKSDGPKPQ